MDDNKYALSNDYVEFLKTNEGLKFKPYDSKEGGTPTIGFGHKLTKEELKSGKVYGFDIKNLKEDEADAILLADLAAKQDILDKRLSSKYGISLSELDPVKKEMLLDYEFNTGDVLGKFPKFSAAVMENDLEGMRKEYVRKVKDPKSGKMIPLKMRNETFFARYLAPKPITYEELAGLTGTGLENELLARTDMFT